MKKIIWIYGLIAGTIVASMMFVTMAMYKNGSLDIGNGETIGYTTMIIALSMIFFGVKSYRDNYSAGIVSFWQATKIGILIALVASVMYALSWEVVYSQLGDEFAKKMTEQYFEKMKAKGATEEEMQKAKEQWSSFSELYKNPVIRFGVTLTEILPVGIVITLLSAGLLRKKEFLPGQASIQS